jgi:Ca2+:H+ antiporter
MSSVFIGLVVVAVVGGAAESLSAVAAARNGKLDLTNSIVFGSCIQIALFVAPVLVLLSRFVGPGELYLTFNRSEVGALFLAVLIGSVVTGDGKGNWFKGVQLLVVYAVIASMFYFVPDAVP